MEIVEVASLLHDIQDWKYSGSEAAAATTVQVFIVKPVAADLSATQVDMLCFAGLPATSRLC